jgi:hypothetical protein
MTSKAGGGEFLVLQPSYTFHYIPSSRFPLPAPVLPPLSYGVVAAEVAL